VRRIFLELLYEEEQEENYKWKERDRRGRCLKVSSLFQSTRKEEER
jgi:hypothetical protein